MKLRLKTRSICSHRIASRDKKIKGDIAGALKELHSKENVRGLATAVITAGLVQGLGVAFNLPTGAGTNTTILEKLQTNLINGVAGSLVSNAINGGSLEDNLKNAIKTAIISAVAAQGAGIIGDLKSGDNPALNQFTGTLAHAFLGCAVGSATAGSSSGCAAGAGGAVAGELSAEWYGKTFGGNPADAASFAKLTTAIAGLAGGANAMTIAGITSSNAVTNNYLTHVDIGKREIELKDCRAKNDPSCEVKVLQKYDAISAKNTAEINYNSVLEKGSLEEVKKGLDILLKDPTVSAESKQQAKKSLNEINVALNVIEKSPIIKNAAEVGLLAADILLLGELTAAKLLTTKVIKDLVLKRTGTELSEIEAMKISNNFYADSENIYAIYKKSDGTWNFPLNGGAVPGTEKNVILKPGYQIDRYGSPYGDYVAPAGSSIGGRALFPGRAGDTLTKYEVIKPLPDAVQSVVAPAFGQTGGGVQIQLNNNIQWYLDNNYLKVIK